MPNPNQLPSLLALLEDEDPIVRDAVVAELATFGGALEQHLAALPSPPSAERRRAIERLVRHHGRQRQQAVRPEEEDLAVERGILYEVGQLVRHRRYGYRGVVVNTDLCCQASREWYRSNRTRPPRNQPWYHVLVHGTTTVTYAAQTSLQEDGSTDPVLHPLVRRLFRGFEDGRYLRNDHPWPDDRD